MSAALPIEVYEARDFWMVTDSDGATWVVRPAAGWAHRKPYRGGVRGVQRMDQVTERLVLQHLVDGSLLAA